ncbi:HEAT repeat domain-containing protein [Chondromyces apiculatus]|uniref:HEAT repeat domain-containing protein n=1 Tax=Chondromyces apiculatus TaxID=51 RepID=UPI0005C5712D|nr:HEAT repeat domain-containing protein [Chondromyces apiculatus]
MPNRQAIETTLGKLFDAERTVRKLHDELAMLPPDQTLDVLLNAVQAAKAEQDEDEAVLRLVRLSSLLGEHEGPRAVDALVDVLASEHPEARRAAGEELEGLAYDRFKEVAQGVERALARLPAGSPALYELPYLIAEVPEPGVTKLLAMFLKHSDADAVSAAIEALVEIGDPGSAALLRPLVGDKRTVEMEDDSSDATSDVTLGELAEEALGMLSPYEDDEEEERS